MESLRSPIDRIRILFTSNYLVVVALSAVLLHLSPYYVFGQDVYIGVHDTFDSVVVWFKALADSGMLFSGSLETIPLMMNGLPRLSFGSEFYALVWLFYFFEPFTAYVLNITAMHLVGFFGMFLLLKSHFLQDEKYNSLSLGVAVCFAVLPLWPPAGLSVSSLPLTLWAFMNIRTRQDSKRDWLVLLLIPFYSSLVYSYVFFIILIGVLWIWDLINTRGLHLRFLGAIVLMTIEFLLIEYRLVLGLLFGQGFVSHRLELRIWDFSMLESLDSALKNLILGHYHASTLHGLVILFSVAFSMIAILLSRSSAAKKPLLGLGFGGLVAMTAAVFLLGFDSAVRLVYRASYWVLLGSFYPLSLIAVVGFVSVIFMLLVLMDRRSEDSTGTPHEHANVPSKLVVLLFASVIISLWFGLWFSFLWVPLKQQFALLRTFQFQRLDWMHPLLYYILFAIALRAISDDVHLSRRNYGKVLAIALVLLQVSILFPNNWAKVSMGVAGHDGITYRQFYAEDLFQEIEDDIGLPQDSYRVINIGLHPAIAQYNGFYTLDGYSNNYPLEYKHRFRQIISRELDKNSFLMGYFDTMGSRCYVLVDELDGNFMCTKDQGLVVNNLELNITAMNEMAVSYIFSAVNITNYLDNSLQLNGVYENDSSAWRIFLYEVI